jgi:hypothetical protein
VREWEERQQMLGGKVRHLEEHRNYNILIFGLEERRDEGYFNTPEVVMEFSRETVKLEAMNGSID